MPSEVKFKFPDPFMNAMPVQEGGVGGSGECVIPSIPISSILSDELSERMNSQIRQIRCLVCQHTKGAHIDFFLLRGTCHRNLTSCTVLYNFPAMLYIDLY